MGHVLPLAQCSSFTMVRASIAVQSADQAPYALQKPFQRGSGIADSEKAWLCSMACLACSTSPSPLITSPLTPRITYMSSSRA